MGLRISAEIARRAFPAPRGGTADSPGHVARLEVFTRTEAVTGLRLMVGCSGKDAVQFATQCGRITGGIQLDAQGISDLKNQRAGIRKPMVFMTYVREAGEGAKAVSVALAQTQYIFQVRSV